MESRKLYLTPRKSHRYSWMLSGWIKQEQLGSDGGGTACFTLGCPDDYYAVRLGFANVTPVPWTITKAIACAPSEFGDYVNPRSVARWSTFTFASKGCDTQAPATSANAPNHITVWENQPDPATGEMAHPRWTWTDWLPLSSSARDPGTDMRVLMLRALIPGGQTVCYANGQLTGMTRRRDLTGGYECFAGGVKFGIDRVTDPTGPTVFDQSVWRSNSIVNGVFFPIVQFMTRRPSLVGIATGDSHHQGTSTTEQFTSFLFRTTVSIGKQQMGQLAVGMVNSAVSGLTSAQFFPRLDALLGPVQPAYAVLPGWSFNDNPGTDANEQGSTELFMARLLAALDNCERARVIPIVLTPFPRDPLRMTPTRVQYWLQLRELILEMREGGTLVIDASTLLGQPSIGTLNGTYLPQMASDGAHPNDEGHQAIAAALEKMIDAAILCRSV